MKTQNVQTITRTGVLSTDVVRASINTKNAAHIFSLLTDIYKDPIKAVVSEYPCNAYDAIVEAGHASPVRVTLPTRLHPVFVVADNGVGMNYDELKHCYTEYGTSTKDTSDDYIGSFGIGCKAALTYTNQFTIASTKNGVRTEAAFYRTADGIPEMAIIDTAATDAPNGTTVSIMVEPGDIDAFARQCATQFKYWEPGTILVNGVEPARPAWTKIGADMLIDKSVPTYQGEGRVVMGNMAYPVLWSNYGIRAAYGLVARVPIGAVDIVKSRDDLQKTPRTVAVLEDIAQRFNAMFKKELEKELKAIARPHEAVDFYCSWGQYLPNDITWCGRSFDRIVTKPVTVFNANQRQYAVTRNMLSVGIKEFMGGLHVVNFGSGEISATVKRRIREYLSQRADTEAKRNIVFLHPEGLPESDWSNDAAVVDYAVIKAVKFTRKHVTGNNPHTGRPKGSWDYWSFMGFVTHATIPDNTRILYAGTDFRLGDTSFSQRLRASGIDAIVVRVPANRLPKFLRDYPQAEAAMSVFRAEAIKMVATIPNSYWRTKDTSQPIRQGLRALRTYTIDDPDVWAAINSVCSSAYDTHAATYKQAETIYGGVSGPDVGNFDDVFANYPLAQPKRFPAETAVYINALYASGKDD